MQTIKRPSENRVSDGLSMKRLTVSLATDGFFLAEHFRVPAAALLNHIQAGAAAVDVFGMEGVGKCRQRTYMNFVVSACGTLVQTLAQ